MVGERILPQTRLHVILKRLGTHSQAQSPKDCNDHLRQNPDGLLGCLTCKLHHASELPVGTWPVETEWNQIKDLGSLYSGAVQLLNSRRIHATPVTGPQAARHMNSPRTLLCSQHTFPCHKLCEKSMPTPTCEPPLPLLQAGSTSPPPHCYHVSSTNFPPSRGAATETGAGTMGGMVAEQSPKATC